MRHLESSAQSQTKKCHICQEKKCEQNQYLLKSMDYFSTITQHTLSAFHKAVIDPTMNEEMEDLKKSLRKKIQLKLIDARPLSQELGDNSSCLYERLFDDGSKDIVRKEEIFDKKYGDEVKLPEELQNFVDNNDRKGL